MSLPISVRILNYKYFWYICKQLRAKIRTNKWALVLDQACLFQTLHLLKVHVLPKINFFFKWFQTSIMVTILYQRL